MPPLSSLIASLNQIISSLLLLSITLLSPYIAPFLPKISTTITPNFPKVIVPAKNIIASRSATLSIPTPVPPVSTVVPWGQTEKLGPGLYRTYVENDPTMGTPGEILQALNVYRRSHNRGELQSDPNLCSLAQKRANEQDQAGTLDSHKGLENYMNDPKHWQELDVTAIGENASYGYVLSGTHLIEWVFNADEEHRDNQLNPNWNLACPAVVGVTVDIIFGKR